VPSPAYITIVVMVVHLWLHHDLLRHLTLLHLPFLRLLNRLGR
jgi:hypothetical protein